MAPASNEEQFKFLISCIRYSNGGKVDFGEVAKECNIVTKGAAAKRYERMMKSHGIAPNATSARASQVSRIFKVERKASIPTVKKRKVDDFAGELGATVDDDEIFDNVKSDPSVHCEQLQVKSEPGQAAGTTEIINTLHFIPPASADCNDQRCHGTNSMYDQNTATFETNNNGGNIYSLTGDTGFIPFNSFEHQIGSNAEINSSHARGHQGDSILITD